MKLYCSIVYPAKVLFNFSLCKCVSDYLQCKEIDLASAVSDIVFAKNPPIVENLPDDERVFPRSREILRNFTITLYPSNIKAHPNVDVRTLLIFVMTLAFCAVKLVLCKKKDQINLISRKTKLNDPLIFLSCINLSMSLAKDFLQRSVIY